MQFAPHFPKLPFLHFWLLFPMFHPNIKIQATIYGCFFLSVCMFFENYSHSSIRWCDVWVDSCTDVQWTVVDCLIWTENIVGIVLWTD